MENRQDYRTEMAYGGRGISRILRKPKCFNCNVYGHIVKNCRKPKKERDTRKWYI